LLCLIIEAGVQYPQGDLHSDTTTFPVPQKKSLVTSFNDFLYGSQQVGFGKAHISRPQRPTSSEGPVHGQLPHLLVQVLVLVALLHDPQVVAQGPVVVHSLQTPSGGHEERSTSCVSSQLYVVLKANLSRLHRMRSAQEKALIPWAKQSRRRISTRILLRLEK
ncbi:hypothetical protein PENTCL1PPCAC_19595, partial [Pristionchus entomophagus]